MRLIKKILIIILVLLILGGGIVYIDYFLVKTKNIVPKLSIKEEQNADLIVYKAIFYKVWYCKTNDTITLGNYNDPDAICPREYEYVDGYYTNSLGVSISQKDLELIKNGIYTSEMIEAMKSESEVKDAVYIAYNYGKIKYQKALDENKKELKSSNGMNLIVFPEFIEENGEYKWIYNSEKYYCLNETDNTYSEYIEEKCDQNYQKITLDKEWCGKYKNSILVYNDEIKKICEE